MSEINNTLKNKRNCLMETFEEYWKSSPGMGNLVTIPRDLALQIAKGAYIAGQASAAKWINKELEKGL